ncbi:hypothetical protein BH11GEM1_BH11GEM1_28720 [soil metagenome]
MGATWREGTVARVRGSHTNRVIRDTTMGRFVLNRPIVMRAAHAWSDYGVTLPK